MKRRWRWCIFTAGFIPLQCGSFAARCGIWPGDRESGRAEAPASAYWKRAVVTTSHQKGYAGGHGGGTTFHTMTVKLHLSGGTTADQEFILEKGTLPLTSESDYVYGLISRDYKLIFSPDGTRLAITYDNKDYGYVALATKSRALLFHRERRFQPPAGEKFWSVFPNLEEYAVELLGDLQFTKAEEFRVTKRSDESPYFRTIDSSSDDSVIDLTDRFLADYPHNERIYAATLRGALEVSQQFPLTQSRLEYLRNNFVNYTKQRKTIHDYLKSSKITVSALGYAATILSAKPDNSDLPNLGDGLARFTSEMEKSDHNYRVYHAWDFNRYLWAIAASVHKLRTAGAPLTTALQRVLRIDKEEMRYDIHPAQVYALQTLVALGARPQLPPGGQKDETSVQLPAIWPREYKDPQRDYCEWQETYSDCRRYPLSSWARAAVRY